MEVPELFKVIPYQLAYFISTLHVPYFCLQT